MEPAAFNRFCPSKTDNDRPGDVTICPSDDLGTVIAVDVTVCNATSCRGTVAKEKQKMDHYMKRFKNLKSTIFYPFALTLEGEGGPSARKLCSYMAMKMAASPSNGLNLRVVHGGTSSRGWQTASRQALVCTLCAV